MSCWSKKKETMGDDPPYLAVGTEVSAKYKGAFCEAKIRKVVRSVKCKVIYKQGLGGATVTDDQIKGTLRAGSVIEVKHPEKKEYVEANITKIQDCSQYTVVFDDGDITTLRRSALCLKSGRHFAESETLDQLPLTHPEHFSTPVIGGRRGRRNRNGVEDSSDDDDAARRGRGSRDEKEADIGRVVCVEGSDKKKQKDNWFPGLVVAPTAQDTVRIHVKDEYLVRSFKDGRYYTVPKKEATEFTREIGLRVDNHTLRAAVDKALMFLDRDELPPHWDRELLFGLVETTATDSEPGYETDSSDDEPREEKDHFVAQLYKFMDDRGTPINKGPTITTRDVDLYRLFKVVHNLGGYNRVTNHNHWKTVSHKIGFGQNPVTVNLVKHAYKKFLHSFEEFYRKLGCTMVNHPRINRNRNKTGRSLIRDRDRTTPVAKTAEPKEKPAEKEEDTSTSTNAQTELPIPDVKIKIEPDEQPPVLREATKETQRVKSADGKDKGNSKKSPPADQPPTLTKVKEEKPEENEKPVVEAPKETPKKAKTRKTQSKSSQPETKKGDNSKEAPKEKKKRLFSRITTKKEKLPKVSKPSGLTTTRQKRTMKERVKAIVDKLKLKPTKDASASTVQETVEKALPGTKLKTKEETGNVQVKSKKEEVPIASAVSEEKRKTGRKRKDRQDAAGDMGGILPRYKTICVGDKLKVFYGPTHESKVTYEAKVLNIRGEGGEVNYFVHYTGWNTRYDEWIKYSRIADNLSWTPGRMPKKQNASPKSSKRKCNTSKGESGGRSTPSSITSTSSKTKTRTPKSKSSISESEVEYDSETTDVEHAMGIKMPTTNFQEIIGKDDVIIQEETVPEPQQEKKRGKRKLEELDDIVREKKRSEEKVKIEIIETKMSIPFPCLPPIIEPMQQSGMKLEQDDDVLEKNDLLLEDETISESMIEDIDIEINEVKMVPFVEIKAENMEVNESDYDETQKQSKKHDKNQSESSDDSSHKAKNWDNCVESDHVIKTEVIVYSGSSQAESSEKRPKLKIIDKDIGKRKKNDTDEDNPGIGRDFDLNQIRSELKGIDKTIKVASGTQPEQKEGEDEVTIIKSEVEEAQTFEAEDIYEFKEPEPFYFEARNKNNDDKLKLSRRNIGRIIEELKVSPGKRKIRPSSPVPVEPKKKLTEEPEKEIMDADRSNVPILEACEETFDKICASPLRAATEEPTTEMKLFNELPAEDDDELDEDSEDRLVISEHESDSEALFTHQYRNHEEIFPTEIRSTPPPCQDEPVRFSDYSCKSPDDLRIENKDNFRKEEEEEEDVDVDVDVDGDVDVDVDVDMDEKPTGTTVPITSAIHRVIAQNSTDESNEDDISSAPPSPKMETILEDDSTEKPTETDIILETEETRVEPSLVPEVIDPENKPEVESDQLVTMDVCEPSAGELNDLKDTVITSPSEAKEPPVLEIEEPVKRCATEFEIAEETTMLGGESSNLIEESEHIEIAKEDTSEGNIVALLCKETIPGSPAPQLEPVEIVEEKPAEDIASEASFNKESTIYEKPVQDELPIVPIPELPVVKEAAPVMDNTPPTTPESPMSSISISPRGERSGSSPPLDNESTKSHRESEIELESFPEPKEITDDDSRIEESVKVESIIRVPAKKGRRSRKRSEDAGKRKFPRRHHASDSDDTSENSVSHRDRLDISSSRPSRPCKYNFSVQLAPDMDANQRISILTQALSDLRKTYANVKSELASIDRRRKKLRKRERENALNRLH